jgi:hypothetical protein
MGMKVFVGLVLGECFFIRIRPYCDSVSVGAQEEDRGVKSPNERVSALFESAVQSAMGLVQKWETQRRAKAGPRCLALCVKLHKQTNIIIV